MGDVEMKDEVVYLHFKDVVGSCSNQQYDQWGLLARIRDAGWLRAEEIFPKMTKELFDDIVDIEYTQVRSAHILL
jgi:hypothetical protein